MNNSPYYLLLTGAYNNVGDHLIAHRSKKLLEKHRPDRDVIELSRKVPLVGDKLDLANAAKAIIIAGGPALRRNLYPQIVKLNADLSLLKAPIALLGVGWKDASGDLGSQMKFEFNPETSELLKKLEKQSFGSSTRDFTSFSIAKSRGYQNFVVTGCPALFNESGLVKTAEITPNPTNIVFSPGVSYLKDINGLAKVKYLAKKLKSEFPHARIVACFHHSIDKTILTNEYGPTSEHIKSYVKTETLIGYLKSLGFDVVDASANLATMQNCYDVADFHIGYRVHGHVYMISRGKPSFLLAEDNRALGFKELIGGSIFDMIPASTSKRVLGLFQTMSKTRANVDLQKALYQIDCIFTAIREEMEQRTVFTQSSLDSISNWETEMVNYLRSLP